MEQWEIIDGIPHIGVNKKASYKETKLQEQTCTVLKMRKKFRGYHVPNERKIDKSGNYVVYLQNLKKQGVIFGIPDWTFYHPFNFWIELKVKGGKLTSSESLFILDHLDMHYPCFVCWNLDAFNEVLDIVESSLDIPMIFEKTNRLCQSRTKS